MFICRVQQRLKAMPPLRAWVAHALMAASAACVHAQRVVDGTALRHALNAPGLATLLWAGLVAQLLAPLHALAKKLVYGKVSRG